MTPPTITPVLFDDLAAEDVDADRVEVDVFCEAAISVEVPVVWEESPCDEGAKFVAVEADEAVSEAETTFPSTTKSPLPSLQQLSARVPFPQQ